MAADWVAINKQWKRFKPLLQEVASYGFLVYPRNEHDIPAHFPIGKESLPEIGALGLISPGASGKTGIIIGISHTADQLERFTTEELQALLERVQEFIRVPHIALAGRLPAFLARKRVPFGEHLIAGQRGTLFAIEDSIETIARMKHITSEDAIAVLGLGYIGWQALNDLPRVGFPRVIGVDQRIHTPGRRGFRILTNDLNVLRECRLIVTLTGEGNDIEPAIPFIEQGTLVLDDTNPEIPVHLARMIPGEVYRVMLGLEDVRFQPPFQGFHSSWIPGCVAETIVKSMGFDAQSQQEFNRVAREIGLRALLPSI